MKDKIISIPIKQVKLEADNQYDLTKVGFKLLTEGAVSSHGLYMELDSLKSIKDSIDLKPILCAYETDEDGNKTDFMGHEIEYQVIKKGKTTTIKTVYIEQPVGVLDDIDFSVQEIDGVNWVTCNGYLYNEYCEDAVRILNEADGEKSVSIEFKILDGYESKDDGLYHATKIHFLGVTLLGEKHNPAIMGANITSFTEKQNALFTEQFERIVESVNRLKKIKGGEGMEKEKIIEKYKHLKGIEQFESIVSNEELSLDEIDKQLFALGNRQIERAVREELTLNIVEKANRWGEKWQIQKYYIEDIIVSDNIVVCEDNENYYAYYGIPFTMQGDKAVLEYDKAERYIKGDWRKYEGDVAVIEVNPVFTKEFEAVSEKIKEEFSNNEKLSKELEDLKVKFTDVQSDLDTSNEELERLKTFEKEVLDKERQIKIDEIVSQFEELKEVQGFEELVSEKSKENIEELEKALKIFAFDNGVVLKKGKKKTFSKEPQFIKTNQGKVSEELTDAEKRYGAYVKKYISNY